jgi:hypothetical protein
MLLTGKLAFVGIGVLTLVGSALLQMPDPGHRSHAQVEQGGAGDEISQVASNEVGSVYREVSAEISPRLQSLPDTADAFVRGNAATARLQFEAMANAFPNFSAFVAHLPGTASYLIRGGVPGAVQDSRSEANALADKIPVVKAWKSNIDHMANMHPALNGGAPRF